MTRDKGGIVPVRRAETGLTETMGRGGGFCRGGGTSSPLGGGGYFVFQGPSPFRACETKTVACTPPWPLFG